MPARSIYDDPHEIHHCYRRMIIDLIILHMALLLTEHAKAFVSGGKVLLLWEIIQCYCEGMIGVLASPAFAVPRPLFVLAHDEQSPLTIREGFASLVFGSV